MNRKRTFKVNNEIDKNSNKGILKSTPFIVCDIFLERYATAGILTILPLFLHLKLGFSQNLSTTIFHAFNSTALCFTIVGTIIADTWLGLYPAIILFSSVYITGLSLVTITMIELLNLPQKAFIFIGLIIIIIGSGSLKNNLNAFGGGQHNLPEQKVQLEKYFSVQYFGVKCGSFLTRLISPIVRANTQCFGKSDCYSLSFGIYMFIMSAATAIFLMGSSKYKTLKPNGNMLVKVFNCVTNAIAEKSKTKQIEQEDKHWLKYSTDKYGKKLVFESKAAIKVCLISLPLPIFWACLMQQRSKWIFQGTRMNGDLGWFTLNPDQMIVLNSFLAVICIPFLEKFIYPFLERVGIKSMLQRLIFGGVLIIIAFTLVIIVEITIQYHFISIAWQIPQFVIIAIAETITYISHLNFAYGEACSSMKPVMMTLLYLSMAGGDFIVAIISSLSIFPSHIFEFSFYLCMMLVNVVIFTFLTYRYKHVDHELLRTLENEE